MQVAKQAEIDRYFMGERYEIRFMDCNRIQIKHERQQNKCALCVGFHLDTRLTTARSKNLLTNACFGYIIFSGSAPLAQLVEHLTLNQGVHGSSP